MADVVEELLRPDQMAAARALLVSKHPWFLHAAPMAAFEKIQSKGLKPHNPGAMPSSMIAGALPRGHKGRIICLRPIRTDDSTPKRGSEFALALPASALPLFVTLDWSFSGTLELARIIKHDSPEITASEVFCEVARRRGSVVVYEPISPEKLRVQIQDCSADPSCWPPLAEVRVEAVKRIDFDLFG